MGRVAATLGTAGFGARSLDRFAGGLLLQDESSGEDSALSTHRTGAILPEAGHEEAGTREDQNGAEAEVSLPQLWFQLSVAERERFGHCFSFLVLKALGLRTCSAQEVEA